MQLQYFVRIAFVSKKGLKKNLLLLATAVLYFSVQAQVSVMKIVGKNAEGYKPSIGLFYFFDIPVNPMENNSVVIEVFDMGNFSVKNNFGHDPAAYLSVKAGFRHIFTAEGKTGLFIEPQAGYCLTTSDKSYSTIHRGLALAMVTGYSREVGFSGNSLVFGFKYETDLPGSDKQISTIGFRFAFNYSFKGN